MSLQIINEPYEISLARNPIAFTLKTNNHYFDANVFPYLKLNFVAKAKNGDGFRFQITDNESGLPVFFLFTAVESLFLDEMGQKYIDESHTGTLAEYVTAVFEQFKKERVLNHYFKLSYEGTEITFEAKKSDADSIPTNFQEIQHTPAATPHNHIDETISELFLPQKARENFRVLLNVYVENNYLQNDFELVATLDDSPGNDGITNFDLSEILNAELLGDLEKLPVPGIEISVPNDIQKIINVKRYYVAFNEYYDAQITPKIWTNDQIKWVHFGGVSNEDWTKQNPFTFLFTEQKFLTWQPDNKILKATQNDWLTWVNFLNHEISIQGKLRIYYKDGTDSGEINFGSVIEIKKWESVRIPVGFTQRDIQTLSGSNEPYKWVVRLVNDTSGAGISEKRAFYLNEEKTITENELLYLNAFGCAETFLTIGEWEESITIKKQFIEKALNFNYSILSRQDYQFLQKTNDTYTVNTGYMNQETVLALRDVLMGADVFLKDQNQYIPVIIDAENFKLTSTLKFLNQLTFKLRRSFTLKSFSKIKRIPKLSAILDCGLIGFKLDTQENDVETFENMQLFYNNSLLFESPYNSVEKAYLFAKQQKAGNYQVKTFLSLTDGQEFEYNFNYNLRHEYGYVDIPEKGTAQIDAQCHSGEIAKLFIDWGVADGAEEYDITDTLTAISKTLDHSGNKRATISTTCKENIRLIVLYSNSARFDLDLFLNLEQLQIITSQVDNSIDLSTFKKLERAVITGTNALSIKIGFHKNLTYFNFNGNNLVAEELEKLVLEIWNYRKYYSVSAKTLLIAGNPGSTGMTAKAVDIINGSGAYVDEGLNDYGFTVTY